MYNCWKCYRCDSKDIEENESPVPMQCKSCGSFDVILYTDEEKARKHDQRRREDEAGTEW